MSVKGSYSTAEPLEWNEAISFMNRLYDDGNYTISLLVGCGIYFGLRISDLLRLTWDNLFSGDTFILFEKKTGSSTSRNAIRSCTPSARRTWYSSPSGRSPTPLTG